MHRNSECTVGMLNISLKCANMNAILKCNIWILYYALLQPFDNIGSSSLPTHKNVPQLTCLSQTSLLCSSQAENIMMLDMDLPARTTKEYQEPVIAPKVAAALEDALRDEDEIQVDASGFHSSLGSTPPASGSLKKPKSG